MGGPYRIRIARSGYRDRELAPIALKPGTQAPLTVTLVPVDVEEVVVTVPARDLNNGVGSAYTAAEIADQPSITRDVIHRLLRDPLAQSTGEGNLSVGGVNPRFNGLAIDGSLQQDDFGLGTSMRPAARRSTSTPSSPRPWPRRTIPSAPRASPAASSMSRPSRAPTHGTARRSITFTAATRWVGENRASLVLDIENVLNLLNDEWGTFDAGPGFGPAAIVRADLVSVADVAALGIDAAPALAGDAPRTTCVRRSDCVYRFNSFRNVAAAFPAASRSVHRIRFGFRIDL